MNKLFRILIVFMSQSISQLIAYRITSIFIVIFGTLFSIGEIVSVLIYYNYADDIFGWDKFSFFILIGTFSLIQYIYQFFFVLQHEEFMDKIIEGELDYDLIRPIDSQLMCSFRLVDISSLINMIIPITLIIYSLNKVPYEINKTSFVLYLIFLLIGVIFYYSLNQFFVALSFWIERPGKLIGIPEYLFDLASRPRAIYPKYLQIFIVFLIPVVSATNVPVNALRGNFEIAPLIALLFVTILSLVLTRIQWKIGIKRYASTS